MGLNYKWLEKQTFRAGYADRSFDIDLSPVYCLQVYNVLVSFAFILKKLCEMIIFSVWFNSVCPNCPKNFDRFIWMYFFVLYVKPLKISQKLHYNSTSDSIDWKLWATGKIVYFVIKLCFEWNAASAAIEI